MSQDSSEGASWKVEILGASSALGAELAYMLLAKAGHKTNPEAVVTVLESCIMFEYKMSSMDLWEFEASLVYKS